MKCKKNIIHLEVQQFVTISELARTNRELTALLYDNRIRRNEIIVPLRHPHEFLCSLKSILDIISYQFDCIVKYAEKSFIEIPKVYVAEVKCLQEADIHVFRNFNCEEINIIENCYLLSTSNTKKELLNPELEFPYSINLLLTLKEDLLVTIVRFEEYIRRFPTQESRNKLIQDYFINDDYD